MTALVEFLLARIDEDQAIATAAATRDYGTANPPRYRSEPHWSTYEVFDYDGGLANDAFDSAEAAERWSAEIVQQVHHAITDEARHIAHHDPARVLAECEAKRRIVALHGTPHECPPSAPDNDLASWFGGGDDPCPTLRALAAVYADHPDHDEQWRP